MVVETRKSLINKLNYIWVKNHHLGGFFFLKTFAIIFYCKRLRLKFINLLTIMEEENKKEVQEQEKETQAETINEASEEKKSTGMAALAYVFFLIPFLAGYKEDEFVMFHVKQGAVLFVIGMVLNAVPLLGWLLNIVTFTIFLIGVKNALDGKEKELPLIGEFAKKINF